MKNVIDRERILALQAEARRTGDDWLVNVCNSALKGGTFATSCIAMTLKAVEEAAPPFRVPIADVLTFVTWLASQPCTGHEFGHACRDNAPHDPALQCAACRASLLLR